MAEIEYNSTKNCFLTIPKTWNICSTNVWFVSNDFLFIINN